MPEITDAQHAEYRRYQQFGTPDEVDGIVKKNTALEGDNKKLRDQRAELNKKVPAEGATVLTGDDAKRWDAFQALKKTPEELAAGLVLTPEEKKKWEAFSALEVKPEDIPNIIKERDELKKTEAQRDRTDAITAAVEAMGWPKEAAATIADMKSLDEATFEVKTEKVKDGAGVEKETPVAYVTVKGGQAERFSEFAAKTDSLKGIRTKDDSGGTTDSSRYVEQTAGGGNGGQGGYDPVKAGKEMAEKQKAGTGTANLALT